MASRRGDWGGHAEGYGPDRRPPPRGRHPYDARPPPALPRDRHDERFYAPAPDADRRAHDSWARERPPEVGYYDRPPPDDERRRQLEWEHARDRDRDRDRDRGGRDRFDREPPARRGRGRRGGHSDSYVPPPVGRPTDRDRRGPPIQGWSGPPAPDPYLDSRRHPSPPSRRPPSPGGYRRGSPPRTSGHSPYAPRRRRESPSPRPYGPSDGGHQRPTHDYEPDAEYTDEEPGEEGEEGQVIERPRRRRRPPPGPPRAYSRNSSRPPVDDGWRMQPSSAGPGPWEAVVPAASLAEPASPALAEPPLAPPSAMDVDLVRVKVEPDELSPAVKAEPAPEGRGVLSAPAMESVPSRDKGKGREVLLALDIDVKMGEPEPSSSVLAAPSPAEPAPDIASAPPVKLEQDAATLTPKAPSPAPLPPLRISEPPSTPSGSSAPSVSPTRRRHPRHLKPDAGWGARHTPITPAPATPTDTPPAMKKELSVKDEPAPTPPPVPVVPATPAAPPVRLPGVPTFIKWTLPDDILQELAAAKARRVSIAAECAQATAASRRAVHELDMAVLDLRLAEQRRRIADDQLERAKNGALGIEYVPVRG